MSERLPTPENSNGRDERISAGAQDLLTKYGRFRGDQFKMEFLSGEKRISISDYFNRHHSEVADEKYDEEAAKRFYMNGNTPILTVELHSADSNGKNGHAAADEWDWSYEDTDLVFIFRPSEVDRDALGGLLPQANPNDETINILGWNGPVDPTKHSGLRQVLRYLG